MKKARHKGGLLRADQEDQALLAGQGRRRERDGQLRMKASISSRS